MQQKISPQAAIAIVVLVLVVVLALGTLWYRKATGETEAAAMHAAMSKTKPGQAPFTKEQMDQMNKMGRKASESQMPSRFFFSPGTTK